MTSININGGGEQPNGNLPPRKQSVRSSANMKYMVKGVSSLALLSGGDDPQRNALHELTMISAEARRIPSFYGLMKRNQEDAVELLQTAAKVQQKLDNVSRRSQSAAAQEILSKHSIVLEVLDKLHTIVRDYVALLQNEVAKSGDKPLEKFMASRGRRKAEQFSSALLVEASVLGELSDDLLQHDSEYQTQPENEGEEVVEILDPDGRQMWVDLFGPTTFMVDVVKVVKGLLKYLQRNLSSDERRTLLQVFDPSSTGQISSIRWNEFLKGFGPMKNCLENLQEMLAQPWFHGFLSKSDSTKLLEVEPNGTFMVRFSSTKPGSFSLAHTMDNNVVNHVIIHTRENGFAVRESAREKLFPSVSHLIEAYALLLKQPYSQTFHRQLWWHGDISGDEASELLKDKKPGTFIIRFSSTQRGCFASSFVGKNNVIEKGLIIGSANGYSLSSKHFQSMEELVASLQQWDVFGEPYKNTTNEINDTMRFRIVNEIVQTEVSYVKTLDLIVNLFVREFRGNPRIRQEEVNQIFANVDQLLALHRNFVAIIERVIQNWDAENAVIGAHFLQLNPALVPHYSVYVNNYNTSLATLDRILKKKELKDWISGVMAKQKSQNMLSGLLIQPVQRIPRYILLLTDLIKHTPGPHSDYDSLGDALEVTKRTMDMINEGKRQVEDCDAVRQKCIDFLVGIEPDQLAVPGRYLVKEGALAPVGVKKDDHYVFVFNDLLMLTKKQGKKFKVKESIPLDTIQVIPIPETPSTQNQFRICTSTREMTFETDQKAAWVADLKKEFAGKQKV